MESLPTWAWYAFGGVMLPLIGLDLFVHRGGRHTSRKAAIVWSAVWIGVGLAFGLFVWGVAGGRAGQEYLAAYLIEKSLSLDNLFVFLLVFESLSIAPRLQHTALLWGIFGALVFRAVFVFVGAAALRHWHWVSYVFGGILFAAAVQAFRENPAERSESGVVRWLSRRLPVTRRVDEPKFFVTHDGRRCATPLLVSVVALELTDILFAIDSVPAALSVTGDEFLVYSSNAFAILGLRALYLVMARTIAEMRYLHYGLAGVLAFAGFKMVTNEWIHVPPLLSVGVIVALIGAAVLASLRARKRADVEGHGHPQPG